MGHLDAARRQVERGHARAGQRHQRAENAEPTAAFEHLAAVEVAEARGRRGERPDAPGVGGEVGVLEHQVLVRALDAAERVPLLYLDAVGILERHAVLSMESCPPGWV